MFRRRSGHEKTSQADSTKLRMLGSTAFKEATPKTYKNFQDMLREVGWEGASELITTHAAAAVRANWDSEERKRFERLWWGVPEGATVKISPTAGLEHLDGQLRMVWRRKDSIKKEVPEEGFEGKLTRKMDKVGEGYAEIESCFGFRPYRHSEFRNPWGSFDEISFPYLSFVTSLPPELYAERLVALRVNEQGEPLFQLQLSPPEASASV